MKTLFAFICLVSSLIAVANGYTDPADNGNQTLSESQVSLASELKTYVLPAHSMPPLGAQDKVLSHAVSVTYQIALTQGLIADGRNSEQGLLFAGHFEDGRPMFLAIQFYQLLDGRLAFTYAIHAKYPDTSACAKMSKKLLSALNSGR